MDYPFPAYSWKAADSGALETLEQRDAFLEMPVEGDSGSIGAPSRVAD